MKATSQSMCHPSRSGGPPKKRLTALVMLAAALVYVFAAPARGQDAITLRGAARLAEAGPLTLGAVAELQGEAKKLADRVVVALAAPDAGGTYTVALKAVRDALEQDTTINMGRLTLRGNACVVRFGTLEAPAFAGAAAAKALPTVNPGDTVRDHVAERLSGLLGVASADLRLAFDASDAELLNMGVGTATIAVQPTGAGDRTPVTVRLYRGDRILATGSVRVGVLIRRRVLVAGAPIARGVALLPEMVTRDEQWLPPSASPAGAGALGQIVRTKVAAGQVLGERDIEPPVVVKRGDVIAVDCTSGGFVVRTTARAMEAGRDGDVIGFQSLTSKHTFKARMNGPGRAVTVAPGRGDE